MHMHTHIHTYTHTCTYIPTYSTTVLSVHETNPNPPAGRSCIIHVSVKYTMCVLEAEQYPNIQREKVHTTFHTVQARLGFAPFFSRMSTTSVWPSWLAINNEVRPSCKANEKWMHTIGVGSGRAGGACAPPLTSAMKGAQEGTHFA